MTDSVITQALKKKVRLYVLYNSVNGYQSEPIPCCDFHIGTFGNNAVAKVKIADECLIPCEDCETEAGESPHSSGKLFEA